MMPESAIHKRKLSPALTPSPRSTMSIQVPAAQQCRAVSRNSVPPWSRLVPFRLQGMQPSLLLPPPSMAWLTPRNYSISMPSQQLRLTLSCSIRPTSSTRTSTGLSTKRTPSLLNQLLRKWIANLLIWKQMSRIRQRPAVTSLLMKVASRLRSTQTSRRGTKPIALRTMLWTRDTEDMYGTKQNCLLTTRLTQLLLAAHATHMLRQPSGLLVALKLSVNPPLLILQSR